jgi:hypothetical protein
MTSTVQYYVLTLEPRFASVIDWIRAHRLDHSIHLNRTRFWVPLGTPLYTDFILRFSDCVTRVDPDADLATGLKTGV